MKIGIDIDGVILNSEELFRVKSELYDLLKLHKKGVINKRGFFNRERYDWTDKELESFREKYFVEGTKEAPLMPGVKEVLELLKNDGHELIIITARGLTVKKMKEAGEKKLSECNLKFDKYYWSVEDKLEVCVKENIDVMIDDKASICKNVSENKIKSLYFRNVNREILQENDYLKEVNNWGEVYRYIYNLNLEEVSIGR